MKEPIEIRGTLVHCHALIDEDGVVLIDGGFLGKATARIERALASVDKTFADVKAIIISHGHLDHTLNIAALKELTVAPVYACQGEKAHIEGRYDYRGLSRVCGLLEAVGRVVLKYRAPSVDHWFADGDVLPFWGGLEVVDLPGHTLSHCGFYSASKKVLFASDLFANHFHVAMSPPRFLNVDSALAKQSIIKANALDLSGGVILNHGNAKGPQQHREDLARLARS